MLKTHTYIDNLKGADMEKEFKSFVELKQDAMERKKYWMRPWVRELLAPIAHDRESLSYPMLFCLGFMLILLRKHFGTSFMLVGGVVSFLGSFLFAVRVAQESRNWKRQNGVERLQTFPGVLRRFVAERILAARTFAHPHWSRTHAALVQKEKALVSLMEKKRDPAWEVLHKTLERDIDLLEHRGRLFDRLCQDLTASMPDEFERLAKFLEVFSEDQYPTIYCRTEVQRTKKEIPDLLEVLTAQLDANLEEMEAVARAVMSSSQLVGKQKADA